MSVKLFKDTLSLSEFRNQRFLYGNFLPALCGTYVYTSIILWVLPFTTDYLPLLGILTIFALIAAFITNRLSRGIIFFLCRIESKYENYLQNDMIVDAIINTKLEENKNEALKVDEKSRKEEKQRLIIALREDFKKTYKETFFYSTFNQMEEELQRYETGFLLGFWGGIWSILCELAFFLFSQEFKFQILFLKSEITINEIFILVLFILLAIIAIFTVYIEGINIRNQILTSLPLYIKPNNPLLIARSKAIREFIQEIPKEFPGDIDVKKLILTRLEDEIDSFINPRFSEKVIKFRFEQLLVEKKISSTLEARRITESLEVIKESESKLINVEAADIIRKIRNLEKTSKLPVFFANNNGKIIYFDGSNVVTKIETLKLICQLSDLKKLKLMNCKISTIPPEIGQLNQLKELKLNRNQLTTIPPEIGQLDKLEVLWLSRNKLATIPSEIGRLTYLRNLRLNENQLINLPPEIGQLNQLKELRLNRNQLTTIPLEIGQLNQLEVLWLNSNKLSKLLPEINQLTQLKDLNLIDNQITSLPSNLNRLTKLRNLWLKNNEITTLPSEIGRLTNLIDLNLINNRLETIPPEIGQLNKLKTLSLIGNELKYLPKEIAKLKELDSLTVTFTKDMAKKDFKLSTQRSIRRLLREYSSN